jgi:pimeloyl-ACP methyl ester carboxylesterase
LGFIGHSAPEHDVPFCAGFGLRSVFGVSTYDRNPDALLDGQKPVIRQVSVGGTTLYVEEQGSGAAVLLIGAADEDAEFYRGIADRLASGSRVVTYDRRGTRRSGREGWPSGSARHADDAADLISSLGMEAVTVLGASAGGLVALGLGLRHPDLVKTVLCFEPGLFQATNEGKALLLHAEPAVEEHLNAHPGDWSGAVDALGRAAVSSLSDMSSLFTPPEGKEWFVSRADANADALIRGDLLLTRETLDLEAVSDCPTNLRFAYGTASLPVLRGIATNLAACRKELPDALEVLGHSVYYHPDSTASYIRSWL